MGKTYTTTINIKCWKEHTCVSCGSVHAYQFMRKVTGKARKADASQRQAQANVAKTLKNEVDLRPCPACGIYQPDMIGQARAKWHKTTFWLALIAFAVLLILRATYAVQANTLTWIIAGVGTLAALQIFGKELKNFNANTEANRKLAADVIAAGTMQQFSGQQASAAPEWVRIPRSFAQVITVPALIVGVLLLAGPELVRSARGWALNPQSYPPVIGPGDTTRIYMPHEIESLKGFWRGTATATLNASGAKPDEFSIGATTNDNDWGSTIYVKSDEKRNNSTPWVEMQLPSDSSLAGKTVSCKIQLDIEYPQMSGEGNFETKKETMTNQLQLHLASAGAGALYDQLWWGGGVAGMVMILGICLMLIVSARRLQTKAKPTRILNPAPPAPAA